MVTPDSDSMQTAAQIRKDNQGRSGNDGHPDKKHNPHKPNQGRRPRAV